MGSRAEVVVIDEGKQQKYYTHWGARSLHLDFLPGAQSALRFVTAQKQLDSWVYDLEAAAVIDVDNRMLLWYSKTCEQDEVLRSAVLSTMWTTWREWRLRWAGFGLRDLYDYCDGRWPQSTVLLIGTEDNKGRVYTSSGDVATLLEQGPALVETVEGWEPADRLATLTEYGLMLQPGQRHGAVWAAGGSSGHLQEIAEQWSGWTWENWDYRWDEVVAEKAAEEPDPRLQGAFRALSESFDRHQYNDAGSEAAAELLTAEEEFLSTVRAAGVTVTRIEDNAFTHCPVELSPGELSDTRDAIARAALDALP